MKFVEVIKPNRGRGKTRKQLRVAAYCRVSTEHDEQAGSVESQELHFLRMIQEHPDWTFAGLFSDRGLVLCQDLAQNKMRNFSP